jgi:hypothetical protein
LSKRQTSTDGRRQQDREIAQRYGFFAPLPATVRVLTEPRRNGYYRVFPLSKPLPEAPNRRPESGFPLRPGNELLPRTQWTKFRRGMKQ